MARQFNLLSLFIFLCLLVVIAVSFWQNKSSDWLFAVKETTKNAPTESKPFFCEVYLRTNGKKALHSPSLAMIDSSSAILTWYEGSEEGREDVAIFYTIIKHGNKHGNKECWEAGQVKSLLNPSFLEDNIIPKQKVNVLGNAIVASLTMEAQQPWKQTPQNDDLDLASLGTLIKPYITMRSFGGWSFVKVAGVDLESNAVNILPSAAFFSRTSALRNNPIYYADGGYGIPIYHEVLNNFSEMLKVSKEGKVVAKSRITSGKHEIQPAIIPVSSKRAVAFFRNYKVEDKLARLKKSVSNDGGRSWSPLTDTPLPNPNSPVAGVLLNNGLIALLFNDHHKRRDLFAIAVSADEGETWFNKKLLEDDVKGARYPSFLQVSKDEYMIAYSVFSKKGIKVSLMNEAWIMQDENYDQ